MNAPWFDPNAWAWLPGTAIGCLAGVWGSMVGILAPRGKARGLVVGGGAVLLVLALASGVAGIVAIVQRQPYGIWYGLLLPCVLCCFILPSMLPVIGRAYAEAERRRMTAEDL